MQAAVADLLNLADERTLGWMCELIEYTGHERVELFDEEMGWVRRTPYCPYLARS
jgi:hypothetical protein